MEILETTHSTRTVRASTVKSWRAWRDVKEEGAGPVPLEESGPKTPVWVNFSLTSGLDSVVFSRSAFNSMCS